MKIIDRMANLIVQLLWIPPGIEQKENAAGSLNGRQFRTMTRSIVRLALLLRQDAGHNCGVRFMILSVILCLFLATACEPTGPRFRVDTALEPEEKTLPGFDGGAPRPVAVAVWPDGSQSEFVTNEVIVNFTSQAEIDALLDKYNGVVLRGETIPDIPGAPRRNLPDDFPPGPLLIRLDLNAVTADGFVDAMTSAGIIGEFVFSSEDAAKLMTVIASERDLKIAPNFVLDEDNTQEHPDGAGGFNNTSDDAFWHLSDSDVATNVTRAWEYLRYLCLPLCENGEWEPAIIAVVDRGFNLDPETGVPLSEGGADYSFTGVKPLQADVVDHDGTAGGISNKSSKPWHGQGVFGVCCARPSNQYGGAGTAGVVIRPMLIRHAGSLFERADGIRTAALNGADVVNISSGRTCGWYCKTIFWNPHEALNYAIGLADALAVAVVASAGNDGKDLTGTDRIPCTLQSVICVGAMNRSKANTQNFGAPVDIWAPSGIRSTIHPGSASSDSNDVGLDEVSVFGGTSSAAPFISGVVGLMKAIDKNAADNVLNCDRLCHHEQILKVIQDTANRSSSDPLVSKGYVDALAAVMDLRPNGAPTIQITAPANGASRSWNGVSLRAVMTDPEPGHVLPLFKDDYSVVFTSDLEGELCRATISEIFVEDAPLPEMRCRTTFSQLGTHQIQALGTDPFGATAMATITLTVTNGPPVTEITRPEPGSLFNTQESIRFEALVSDPDETIFGDSIEWAAGGIGIGLGSTIEAMLPAGSHTVTVKAIDGFGEVSEAAVTIDVVNGTAFPSIDISMPEDGLFTGPGTVIQFEAAAADAEDGVLSGDSIRWTSNRDGDLGFGAMLATPLSGPAQACNPETVIHDVTATATDSDGNSSADIIRVTVGLVC